MGSNRELKGHFKRVSDRIRIASRKMVIAAMGLTFKLMRGTQIHAWK